MSTGVAITYPDIQTLAAVIARSPIVVALPRRRRPSLPAGFGEADLAILEWIAGEGRRIGGKFLPM